MRTVWSHTCSMSLPPWWCPRRWASCNTNMVTKCVFTLPDTAKRTLWRKEKVFKRFLCGVFAVAQRELIERSPAEEAQWSWKETAQINPEMTKQRYHFSAFIAPLLAPHYQLKSPVLIRLTTSAETKPPHNPTKSRSQRVVGKIQQDLRGICAVIGLIWRRSLSQRKHLLFRLLLVVSRLTKLTKSKGSPPRHPGF